MPTVVGHYSLRKEKRRSTVGGKRKNLVTRVGYVEETSAKWSSSGEIDKPARQTDRHDVSKWPAQK